jgi:WD40 repeat protein
MNSASNSQSVSHLLTTKPTATQFEVAQPPNDAVSALVFAPDSPTRLLVSSWDKNVYLYEISGAGGTEEARLIKTYEHRAPVLGVCFGANQDEAFTAGMDRQVKRLAFLSLSCARKAVGLISQY